MTDYGYGVREDHDENVFHLAKNGKLICTGFGGYEEVDKAGTFGMDLCENCKRIKTDRNIADQALSDVEVDDETTN